MRPAEAISMALAGALAPQRSPPSLGTRHPSSASALWRDVHAPRREPVVPGQDPRRGTGRTPTLRLRQGRPSAVGWWWAAPAARGQRRPVADGGGLGLTQGSVLTHPDGPCVADARLAGILARPATVR